MTGRYPPVRHVARLLLLGLGATGAAMSAASDRPSVETRCGWVVNPGPANAYLLDADGVWTIGEQGMHQATGSLPRMSEWRTYDRDPGYGYGCACLRIARDAGGQSIAHILGGRGKPIGSCRADPKLPSPVPWAGE